MSRARSNARRCAVQALYQWQMTGQDLMEIETQFLSDPVNTKQLEQAYFTALLHGVPAQLAALDAYIVEFTDRTVERLDLVERAILRLCTYELIHKPGVPYRVVINEGVELAKTFGGDKSHRYINGVLDKLAHKIRTTEIRGKKSR